MPQIFREGTLGDKVRELALPGMSLTEARFTPSRELPWHAHARASLCLVLDGTYVEEFRSGKHQLRAFDLTFKPGGAEHRDRYGASVGAQCLIVDFDPKWIEGLREKGPLVDDPSTFSRGAFPDVGRGLYREFTTPDEISGLAIETACVDLLIHASRRTPAPVRSRAPAWLRRVRDMLEASRGERYTLQQLAHVANVHPVHLSQTFRRTYSCTIGDFARNLLVARAADELARTDRPIATIAIELGFCDQSHLNRVFKRYMRVTPAQYRERYRGHPG